MPSSGKKTSSSSSGSNLNIDFDLVTAPSTHTSSDQQNTTKIISCNKSSTYQPNTLKSSSPAIKTNKRPSLPKSSALKSLKKSVSSAPAKKRRVRTGWYVFFYYTYNHLAS